MPSAVDLTRGGFFAPRKDGTYDTLISAQHVVKALTDAHGEQLGALPALLPESMALLSTAAGSSSLADLAALALQADDVSIGTTRARGKAGAKEEGGRQGGRAGFRDRGQGLGQTAAEGVDGGG